MSATDARPRCPWVDLGKPDYVAYHDHEWGVPEHDDRRLFELLVLEGAQAGLSWYTVLRKRAAYRAALAGFDPRAVARFTAADVDRLMHNEGVVRNRRKLESLAGNARAFLAVQAEQGSFATYLWAFVDGRPIVNSPRTLADYAATSAVSDALSRDLRRRGFKFVGSTIVHALLQAAGLINDHALDCFRRAEILAARPPGGA
ncbi:MAG: DNA-3-methyladenine glycosylase I [Gammaproteobacteria bacterium]